MLGGNQTESVSLMTWESMCTRAYSINKPGFRGTQPRLFTDKLPLLPDSANTDSGKALKSPRMLPAARPGMSAGPWIAGVVSSLLKEKLNLSLPHYSVLHNKGCVLRNVPLGNLVTVWKPWGDLHKARFYSLLCSEATWAVLLWPVTEAFETR